MEIEAHEFEPRPYSPLVCNECEYRKNHPLHSLASVLTGQKPVWVDVGPKQEFVTKDSGKREEFDSGMVRDTQDGKARPDLLFPAGVPYSDQFIIRVAELLQRGAIKYSERNWESAEGQAELDRFKASAFRHFLQWYCGETDEDHLAAVVFNLMGAHLVEWKMSHESR